VLHLGACICRHELHNGQAGRLPWYTWVEALLPERMYVLLCHSVNYVTVLDALAAQCLYVQWSLPPLSPAVSQSRLCMRHWEWLGHDWRCLLRLRKLFWSVRGGQLKSAPAWGRSHAAAPASWILDVKLLGMGASWVLHVLATSPPRNLQASTPRAACVIVYVALADLHVPCIHLCQDTGSQCASAYARKLLASSPVCVRLARVPVL